MPKVALPAHYDGERIQLDEPYHLPKNARLIVVLMNEPDDTEAWTTLSASGLSKAYGDDEPTFSAGDIRP